MEHAPNTYRYTVRATSLPNIEKKVKRIARKATRLNQPAPNLTQSEEYRIEVPLIRPGFVTPKMVGLTVVDIELTTTVIKVPGDWEVAASIKQPPAGETGCLVFPFSDRIDASAAQWQVEPTRCDHCGTSRRRTQHFALIDPEGATKIVGASCIVDHMGLDLRKVAAYHDELAAFVEEADETGGVDRDYLESGGAGIPMTTFLTIAATIIDEHGYRPTREGVKSTKFMAWDQILDGPTLDDIEPHPDVEPALHWARNLTGSSSFDANMKTIASYEWLEYPQAGFAAYIIEGYRRHLADEATKAAAAADDAGYWGELKKRAELTATVTRVSHGWSTYNFTDRPHTWLTMVTTDGRIVEWKASSHLDLDPGDTLEGRATPAEHRRYNDQSITRVTRFAIAE